MNPEQYHTDPNCLFCKILNGTIPGKTVYSDDHCIAFLDIRPVNHGHVLVVPRHHHKDITELPGEFAALVATVIPNLARAVVRATCADGFNIIINNGPVAGQTIFHGHWHIIPRFLNDSVDWPWPHKAYSDEDKDQMALLIEQALESQKTD